MPMQLILNATKPPVLKVDPTIATFTVVGNVDVDVIKSDKSVVNAFVLGLVSNEWMDGWSPVGKRTKW